jgi:hypothetical protein
MQSTPREQLLQFAHVFRGAFWNSKNATHSTLESLEFWRVQAVSSTKQAPNKHRKTENGKTFP